MLLRAAIVMLVMLNLGAAAWWLYAPAAVPVVQNDDPQMPRLRLLSEGMPAPSAAAAALPVQAAAPTARATASEPENNQTCLRLGPFADMATRTSAYAALQKAGASVRVIDIPQQSAAPGWKVFLPPQPSREAAQALAERLRAAGVHDLLVITEGEDANGIALGRFSREDGARRRMRELAAQGVQAQMAPVGHPSPVWLEARLPAAVTPDRIAKTVDAPVHACPEAR